MNGLNSFATRKTGKRIVLCLSALLAIPLASAFVRGGPRDISHGSVRALFCYPLTDITGGPFFAKAQDIGSSADRFAVEMRTALALPVVAKTAIVGVTDDAKCKRASQAIDSINIGQTKGDGLYLVAVGTHYLALPATPNRYIVHLDNLFTVKNKIAEQ
jgi:hypothetical protein